MNEARIPEAKIEEAVAKSLLQDLPPELRARLLSAARHVMVPAGAALFLGSQAPPPAMVVEGLLRVYLSSPDGKQVTVSYVKPGGCVGIVALAGPRPPVTIQTLSASSLVVFDAGLLRAMTESDGAAARAFAKELNRVVLGLLEQLANNVFGSVRQRIIAHLLSLAEPSQNGNLVVAPLTHQELANAIGTAREVASRTMADLSRGGLVTVTREAITLNDPERLLNEAGIFSST